MINGYFSLKRSTIATVQVHICTHVLNVERVRKKTPDQLDFFLQPQTMLKSRSLASSAQGALRSYVSFWPARVLISL
jgi:hypothetical protein